MRRAQVLAPAGQIRARFELPVGAGEEAGEALEVQRQVAFVREPDGARDGGEGPVRGEEEEFGALNPALNDILMRRNAGRRLEETREVVGTQRRDRRKFREREILGEVLFDVGADASERVLSRPTTRGREGSFTDECCLSRWMPRRLAKDST